ncbi:MAG: hypothetical protein KC501_13635 [Myxococcales bacterium]|nr:hypothetical protein [Myxococcales bacterium]
MRHTHAIKITGVLARVGYYGRIRFDVCDPKRKRWVDASFPPDVDGRDWLAVDDTVFAVAAAAFMRGPGCDDRVVYAELVLTEPAPDEEDALGVEEVRSLWDRQAPPAYPP